MIRVVRLGTPRGRSEGVRLGTVRLLPRGVKKEDYAKRNFFDLWLPEVAPSRQLVSYAQARPWTDARWAAYAKRYLAEMRRPEAQRVIALLAALGKQTNFSIRLLLRESVEVPPGRCSASCCASVAPRSLSRVPHPRGDPVNGYDERVARRSSASPPRNRRNSSTWTRLIGSTNGFRT